MYRLSYRDLRWKPVFLQPERYTVNNGTVSHWGSSGNRDDLIHVQTERHIVSLGMPAGQGKISDAGYDQMACLVTSIPCYDHVIFRANLYVSDYPSPESQNGQEGLGLFFRDTVSPDPLNGYPYSNMAATGIIHGKPCIFGREGITPDDIEHIRNFSCSDNSPFQRFIGKKLKILLEKQGTRLTAEITAEGTTSAARYETAVDEEIFSSRETNIMYLGFMAARGCRMEVDLDTVSVEYSDQSYADTVNTILYASPEGRKIQI